MLTDEPEQEFCRERKLEKDAEARTSGSTLILKIKVSNQRKQHTGVKKCSWCGCLYSRVSPFHFHNVGEGGRAPPTPHILVFAHTLHVKVTAKQTLHR